MFRIKMWETEGDRDTGSAEIYGTCQRCCDAIATAEGIFNRRDAVCVEVETIGEEVLVYHISLDLEKGKIIEDNRDEIE